MQACSAKSTAVRGAHADHNRENTHTRPEERKRLRRHTDPPGGLGAQKCEDESGRQGAADHALGDAGFLVLEAVRPRAKVRQRGVQKHYGLNEEKKSDCPQHMRISEKEGCPARRQDRRCQASDTHLVL
jgi:hypothetical protein